MPEDSVRRETQTLISLIRRKGCVGRFNKKILKFTIKNIEYLNKKKNKSCNDTIIKICFLILVRILYFLYI